MGLGDLPIHDPDEEDAKGYREDDVLAVARTVFPPRLLSVKAPERRRRVIWMLRYLLAYDEEGYGFQPSKTGAIKDAADQTGVEPSILYDEIAAGYRNQAEDDNLQPALENHLKEFRKRYRSLEENC